VSVAPFTIALAILAGGNASRLGKQNKLLLELDGETILQHVIESVGHIFPRVYIGVKDERQAAVLDAVARSVPIPVAIVLDTNDAAIKDQPPSAMAGVHAIFSAMEEPEAFLISGDMPLIAAPVVERIIQSFHDNPNASAAVPAWGNGFLEPTLACYNVATMLGAVQSALERGQRSLWHTVKQLHDLVLVPMQDIEALDPGLKSFTNINTAEDYAEAKKIVEKLDER
jgi:molybdopterin-guanine dinucleotide biosynthesis protein A